MNTAEEDVMARGDWTTEVITRMTELWNADRHTTAEIARILNKEFKTAFTGASVISKARLLALPSKLPRRVKDENAGSPPPLRTKLPREKVTVQMAPVLPSDRPISRVRTPPLAIDTAPPIVPSAVQYRGAEAVLALTDHTCKWPVGDPGTAEFYFCGHTPRDGKPYCEYHARRAYQPMQQSTRRATPPINFVPNQYFVRPR